MHRLLVSSDMLQAHAPLLSEAARRHLKVLRPKEGESIELFDGCGATRPAVWRQGALQAAGDVVRSPRPARPLLLFACVTKGARWDWTIEKATELGVGRIIPVLSERTIVRLSAQERPAKGERWQRIAQEAARQSDAVWVPEVTVPVTFGEALSLAAACTCYVGALTTPPPPAILSAASATGDGPVGVFIGPEGDFTPEELSALLAIATPVSFGTTILRAETAAIYALSALKALLDAAEESTNV